MSALDVEHDLTCLTCGYNLRGLALAGLCPECATPVERSRAGNLLRNCEPKWLGRVALGLRLVGAAFTMCAALLIGGLLMVIAGLILELAGVDGTPLVGVVAPVLLVVAGLLLCLAPLLALAGAVLATSPDPGRSEPGRVDRMRAAIRWSAGVTVVAALLLPLGGLQALLGEVLKWAGLLAAAVCIGLLFRYGASLCARVPSVELGQKLTKSGQSFRAMVIVLALAEALRLLMRVWPAAVPWAAAPAALSVVSGFLYLGLILWFGRAWGLLGKLARDVRSQLALARATWPASDTEAPGAAATEAQAGT